MSAGFFNEESLRNEGAGDPWDKEERDKALDDYFAGAHPKELGIKYKKAPKAFLNSILNKLRYNYKKEGKEDQPGRAERYQPVLRTSRKGKKFTKNELDLIRCHREIKLDPVHTARILCRDVNELTRDKEKAVTSQRNLNCIAPTLDLIWAHRYIYFVYKTPVITDAAYDDLVKEEIEYGGGGPGYLALKSYHGWPQHIKSLALYLVDREKFRL